MRTGPHVLRFVLSAFVLAPVAVTGEVSAVTNVGGMIASDTTWTAADSPYLVTSNVLIVSGAKLTVEPDVEVRFSPATGIEVAVGSLVSRGTAALPVLFTSTATGAVDPSERWTQVKFSDGAEDATFDASGAYVSGSILEHTIIEHAGAGGNRAVYADQSSPYLNASTIRDNAGGGLFGYGAHGIRVEECLVTQNTGDRGFGLNFTHDAMLKGNTVSHNVTSEAGAGLWINGATGATLVGNQITDNKSTEQSSGGAHISGRDITLTGNTIARNWSKSTGGGISLDGQYITLTGNVIADNECTSQAGGVRVNADHVAFQGNTITGNTSDWAVAVFVAYSSDVTFTGDRIVGNPGHGVYAFTECGDLVLSADPAEPTWILDNGGYGVYNRMSFTGSYLPNGAGNIDARNVYWGTMDTSEVALMIYDYLDDATKGIVFYDPVAVPEPIALSLLAVGGLGLLRRRRR